MSTSTDKALNTASSADVSSTFGTKRVGTTAAEQLSVALIGPDDRRRSVMAKALAETQQAAVREFDSYPPEFDRLQKLLASFDAIILDLDSDPDVALDLVKRTRASVAAITMVYSENPEPKVAISAMRAGAREYLLLPLEQDAVAEALVRTATTLRERAFPAKKTLGRVLAFTGAKGGSGVTTVACNVAIALAQTPDQRVLLIDLAQPIGDAALCLGISAEYSTEDAFRSINRLDAGLLQSLLVKHRSGVFVLAAPTKILEVDVSKGAIDKLIAVARRAFDAVIVDVGSRIDVGAKAVFEDASTLYLVTQTGISELRNSNRLISQFFTEGNPNLEIVINRFDSRFSETVNEDVIVKALGRPVRWKLPNDQAAARAMQTGDIGLRETRLSRISLEMASSITGCPIPPERKKDLDRQGPDRETARVNSDYDEPLSAPTPSAPTPSAPMPSAPPPSTPKQSAPRPSNPTPTSAGGSATPSITWPAPDPISYGEKLSAAQCNATASVDGTFLYTPGPGYVLPVGTHTLWVTFAPLDSGGNAPLQAATSIVVEKATPALSWPEPTEIVYGIALDDTQLNASTPVFGGFDYSSAQGDILPPGRHTLSVTFTPADSANYTTAEATVSLSVAKATPALSWARPAEIVYGTALDDSQLNASAQLPGRLDYSSSPGDVLPAGKHALSVTFTPADSANYTTAQATVPLSVAKATPALAWQRPAEVIYGTALDDTQLNASSPLPGRFDYSSAAGEVLRPGKHTLSVTFNPADSANYTTAQATVALSVTRAPSAMQWPTPDPIKYGTQLSTTQLCAVASVPGIFEYIPGSGAVLAAGEHKLSVVFTPSDAQGYTSSQTTASLTVDKATPAIKWPTPDPIAHGVALSAAQLNATAKVPGAFAFTPAVGEILTPGMHELSVTFTPTDTLNYTTASAVVSLNVTEKIMPLITWPVPSVISYGTALSAVQLNAAASVPGAFVYTPSAGLVLAPGSYILSASFTPSDIEKYETVQTEVVLEVEASPVIASSPTAPTETQFAWTFTATQSAPADAAPAEATGEQTATKTSPRETRLYKGVIYEKSEDGKWHLQKN
jgi:Flp pilus assembly CpaE family ATPase